jgi:hypothetical protein
MDDARIHELEAKVAELTAMVERLTAPPLDAPATPSPTAVEDSFRSAGESTEATSSRRRMLRNVALAAGGAVAVTVGANALPAAALHQPEDLGLGLVNATVGKTTLNFTPGVGVTGGNALLVQTGTTFPTDASSFPSAVAAWANLATHPTGLYAYTDATGANQAVAAIGVGTLSYGVLAQGNRAALLLTPLGTAGPARADAHALGEVIEDSDGNLWLNVLAGTPGSWRKLAGPATAGSFHPISQVRVYDSRSPAPTPGKLATGGSRVVSVKDGRDPSSGNPTALNAVPLGATAVTGNITVTNTTGNLGGFLTIMPGDAAALVGSSVNWFGPGQNTANSFTAKLDASRQLKIFAGGAPAPDTDFIIDITGYYL